MNDSSYSLDPLIEALSSQSQYNHHLSSSSAAAASAALYTAEGGLTILQPPFFSAWSTRNLRYPRARSYERGWILHCFSAPPPPPPSSSLTSTSYTASAVSPRDWHEFMSSVQAKLWEFHWMQFALLAGPLCVMALIDLYGHYFTGQVHVVKIFFALLAILVLGCVPAALVNRLRFHRQMDRLVNEWRLKFLDYGWIVEYHQQVAVRLVGRYLTCSESYIIFQRQENNDPHRPVMTQV